MKVGQYADGFFFFAATAQQDWHGVTSAPTKESALLDVFSHVRAGLGADGPIQIFLTLPADNRIWRHVSELATLGYLLERGYSRDTLVAAAQSGLTKLHAQLPQKPPAATAESTVPQPMPELTVATDGSLRKGGGPARRASAGVGWLAEDGRYGLRGTTDKTRVIGQQAVLIAEICAIGDAVRSLSAHQLTVLSDSQTAVRIVKQWIAGDESLPPGCRDTCWGRPSPLIAARDHIVSSREHLRCRWIRAHCGDPLNEGADALARLASRFVRGDSGLTASDYASRAAGIAASFSTAFTQQSA